MSKEGASAYTIEQHTFIGSILIDHFDLFVANELSTTVRLDPNTFCQYIFFRHIAPITLLFRFVDCFRTFNYIHMQRIAWYFVCF